MTPPRDLLAQAAARLAVAGVGTPRVDAELLLAHVLRVTRSRLLLSAPLDERQLAEFEALLARRVAREPLQHVLGTAPFRHIEVAVGSGVFVPRPETELLVDAVLPTLRAGSVAVDLCAGSGALALALADEAGGARVYAVERAPAALEWLRRNTDGTGVEVVAADVADPELLARLRGQVDVVVSNPPYVPSTTEVEPEVRADPSDAVFAGVDGLDLMPAVIDRAGELLRAGGVLAIEHDDTQGTAMSTRLHADGRWIQVVDHADLAGRSRYVTAVRL